MLNLESLEKGTPEFQSLTPQQQNERRKLLSLVLNKIVGETTSLGLTGEQAIAFTGDFLEFHLSGKIERLKKEKTGKVKGKRRKR